MTQVHERLLKLQELDREIRNAENKLAQFEPELERLTGPVADLEDDIETLEGRLEEMRTEIRRLENGAKDKRNRLETYEDRLKRVQTEREETAVRTEIELIEKAADADEQEALELMERATRLDLKLDELKEQLEETLEEVEPQRREIVEGRDEAREKLDVLADQRENEAVRMDASNRRLYEQIKGGRTEAVLTPMTADGACSNCFSLIPLQKRTEIRRGNELHRCEACGVILYSEE